MKRGLLLLGVVMLVSTGAIAQTPIARPGNVPLPGPTSAQGIMVLPMDTTPIASNGTASFRVRLQNSNTTRSATVRVRLLSDGTERAQAETTVNAGTTGEVTIPLTTTIVVGSDVQDRNVTLRAEVVSGNVNMVINERRMEKRAVGAGASYFPL